MVFYFIINLKKLQSDIQCTFKTRRKVFLKQTHFFLLISYNLKQFQTNLAISYCLTSITISNIYNLNNFKAKAEEIEGPSITNNMVLNLHESPYNTSPLGLDPANFNPATNAANGRANGRQKRTKKNNVQLPANNSEL